MTRESFDSDLRSLHKDILEMGSLVEESIRESIQAVAEQNVEVARRVIDRDDLVDQMEVSIEENCMKLIALQQPLARDLRTIGTVLKIITDLERMSDHAVNIAEIALRIGTEPLIKPLVDIPRMARMAQAMVKASLDAFVNKDVELARRVMADDEPVDQVYSSLFEELIGMSLRGENLERASQAINLLFVARYLERIADHATNVAERVVYMVTGERVQHLRQSN